MKDEFNFINNLKVDVDYLKKDYMAIVLETKKILKIKESLSFSVSFVSEYMIRKYNKDYRNIDKVTDVISFAMEDSACWVKTPNRELGDIFICYKRALRQAKEYGHSEKRELCFLFVHGLLHLLGYDHQNKKEEETMFSLQERILTNLGVVR